VVGDGPSPAAAACEDPKPRSAPTRTAKARTDTDGITWPPPITGWTDPAGTWHPGDPRRVLYEDWTVQAASIDTADAADRAARDARTRHQAERQAATEQARRPARATPDNLPGRPVRVDNRKDEG
jgi:hypothetical protein